MSLPKILTFAPYNAEWMLSFITKYIDPESIEFIACPNASETEACDLIIDAAVLFHGPFKPFISRKILESSNNLKLIQFGSVGFAQIDLNAASELGIPVANNAGINAIPVAEYVILAILSLMRRTYYGHHQNTQGKWVQKEIMSINNKLCELTGKTVGILGLGTIGTQVVRKLTGFDCNILYNKRNRLPETKEKELKVEYVSFEKLLEKSDILTIHVPLTDETKGMISESEILRMKESSLLINTARSGVVDEVALAKALKNGKLLGAAIDVPRNPDDIPVFQKRFGQLDNVLITPHMASGTRETMIRSRNQLSENIRRVLKGEKLLNLVNKV